MGRKRKPYPVNLLSDIQFNEIYGFHLDYTNLTEDQMAGLEYMLSVLTERERHFVKQHYRDGMSCEAIAKENNDNSSYKININVVYAVIVKSRARLKRLHPAWCLYLAHGYQNHTQFLRDFLKQEEAMYLNVCHITEDSKYHKGLDSLNLPSRIHSPLEKAGVHTVRDLLVFIGSGCHAKTVGDGLSSQICDALVTEGLLPKTFVPYFEPWKLSPLDREVIAFCKFLSECI